MFEQINKLLSTKEGVLSLLYQYNLENPNNQLIIKNSRVSSIQNGGNADEENIVNGFWYGKLGDMQYISIKSFLDNGEHYRLWMYEKPNIELPKGCELRDANEIIPFKMFFKHHSGIIATFADMFRYKLLYEKGGWWTDLDIVSLKKLPNNLTNFIGGERCQIEGWYVPKYRYKVWIGLMKSQKGNPIMGEMYQKMLEKRPDFIQKGLGRTSCPYWGQSELQKILLRDKTIEELFPLNRSGHNEQADLFNPLTTWDMSELMYPVDKMPNVRDVVIKEKYGWKANKLSDILRNSYTIHFYNSMINNFKKKSKVEKEFLLYDYFMNQIE